MNKSGVVVLAALFVGLFALLLGWTAGRAIKAHQADNELVQYNRP